MAFSRVPTLSLRPRTRCGGWQSRRRSNNGAPACVQPQRDCHVAVLLAMTAGQFGLTKRVRVRVGVALPIAGTDDNVALMLARTFCAPPTTTALRRLITHLKRLSGAVVAAIAVLMCLGCGSNVADSGSIQFQMATNRIAYIDSDGQLATVNPDGSDRNLLTAGAVANSGGQVSGVLSQQLPPTVCTVGRSGLPTEAKSPFH